ncbi:MAG TPA: hypothetical protein VNP72_00200, partial [Longimicrobium sp.]|nr:hypothetical protein [Longimicrobium sp.]
MRAAIDWSKGAPNKYAASFSEAERDAMFRKAAAHDLHVWTVRALDQIQVLEVALFTYLLLADGMAAS